MPKDRKDIENTVIEILADRLDINRSKVQLDSDLANDLGMDSFGAVEITFELKDKFGIEIPQEEIGKIKKVRDIVEYISNRLNKG